MTTFTRHNAKAAKLTREQVMTIRQLYESGATQGALAREFGISAVQIGRIVRWESWTDMAEPESSFEAAQKRALATQRIVELSQVVARRAQEQLDEHIPGRARADRMLEELRGAGRADAPDLPPVPQSVADKAKLFRGED